MKCATKWEQWLPPLRRTLSRRTSSSSLWPSRAASPSSWSQCAPQSSVATLHEPACPGPTFESAPKEGVIKISVRTDVYFYEFPECFILVVPLWPYNPDPHDSDSPSWHL